MHGRLPLRGGHEEQRGRVHRGSFAVQQVQGLLGGLRVRGRRRPAPGVLGAALGRTAAARRPHRCLRRCELDTEGQERPVQREVDLAGAPQSLRCLLGRLGGRLDRVPAIGDWKLGLWRLQRRSPAQGLDPVACRLHGKSPCPVPPLWRRSSRGLGGGREAGAVQEPQLCSTLRLAFRPETSGAFHLRAAAGAARGPQRVRGLLGFGV
mmetsp:Transcript_15792/g.54976  ORF Transcript_15792/g.54976 Transcript_15792/m.54976 type:complete len:208 (+) Transcript_15792:1007-1630(+)